MNELIREIGMSIIANDPDRTPKSDNLLSDILEEEWCEAQALTDVRNPRGSSTNFLSRKGKRAKVEKVSRRNPVKPSTHPSRTWDSTRLV